MARGRPLAQLVLTDDGRQVAPTVFVAGDRGAPRRAPPGPAAHLRRRAGGQTNRPRPAEDAPRRRRLERAPDGGEGVEEHRAAAVLAVRGQAVPRQDLQAVPLFIETVRDVTAPY